MRIATWNIERLKHKRELDRIIECCDNQKADILVLTETDAQAHPNLLYGFHTPKLSEAPSDYPLRSIYKPTENRVSIFTNYPCVKHHETYDKYTALCVEFETPAGNLLVYGTIIGIQGSRGKGAESFKKDLLRQAEDFARLSRRGFLCICGDFNCSFADSYYFTAWSRNMLMKAFDQNNISLLTRNQANCIDHIAISKEFLADEHAIISEWNLDKKLSDHKGIAVDFNEIQSQMKIGR